MDVPIFTSNFDAINTPSAFKHVPDLFSKHAIASKNVSGVWGLGVRIKKYMCKHTPGLVLEAYKI